MNSAYFRECPFHAVQTERTLLPLLFTAATIDTHSVKAKWRFKQKDRKRDREETSKGKTPPTEVSNYAK